MNIFFNEEKGDYSLINLSFEDVVELRKVIDSCPLPQKRTFYFVGKKIEEIIAKKLSPKKKQ